MNKYDPDDIRYLITRLTNLRETMQSDIEQATITLAMDALAYLQYQIDNYNAI